ncbi:MAG: hypothetical protein U5L96_07520 [Owenweeksia sp.]|nr:hypothetical protein [Owenweeksia sp.]
MGIFVLLLLLESVFELRQRREKRWNRWLSNGLLAGIGLPFARLLLLPATVLYGRHRPAASCWIAQLGQLGHW